MKLKCLFQVSQFNACSAMALLLLRIVVGAAFILHGWAKIQNPMDWMGADSGFPGVLQLLAAVSEFGGGIALVLGFLTTLGAFGIACTMATAVYMHSMILKDPFVAMSKGVTSWELPATYFMVAVFIMIAGPGCLSLDKKIFGKRECKDTNGKCH